MESFVIKKLEKKTYLDFPLINIEGFKYVPTSSNSFKNIKNFTVVKPEIINDLIRFSFDKKYKKILEFYLNALNGDEESSDGKLLLALDEIARLRNIIIQRYQKVLSRQNLEKLLTKLKILENEIRIKIINFNLIKKNQEVKGKSR